MQNKLLKSKRKGFTLVELIVVLVILAILAALLIPTLTGYIDKAREEAAIAECRQVVVAAQVNATELYGEGETDPDRLQAKLYLKWAEILALSEVKGTVAETRLGDASSPAKLTRLLYTTPNDITVLYDVTQSPVYSIVDDHGRNILSYQANAAKSLAQLGLTPDQYNDKTSKEVQKGFKELYGGSFPPISDYERGILDHQSANPLFWKPVVTKAGVIMVADSGTDKSNPMVSLVYYNGTYYFHTNGYNDDTSYVGDNAAGSEQLLDDLQNAALDSDDWKGHGSGWVKHLEA